MKPRSCLVPFALSLSLLASVAAVAGDGVSPIDFTYLGNAGFMVRSGDKVVLFDSLQGDGLPGYVALPQPDRGLLERAEPPYDGVDLILATHYHRDHFDPASVARHLASNESAIFVSTEQAVEQLRQLSPQVKDLDTRVIGLTPEERRVVELRPNDISLSVFLLHHGRGRDVDNLGFIVELGGKRILHMGDTVANAADLSVYDLKGLDFALVPYWYFGDRELTRALREVESERLVAIHIPASDAPKSYFGGGEKDLDGLLRRLQAQWEGLIVFRELLEQREF
jgi:L-ascorbate metabolism protein UlaG (beta-lactamase superfamily)